MTLGGGSWSHDATSNHQARLGKAQPIYERTVVEGQVEPRVGQRLLAGGRYVRWTVDCNK